MFRDPEWASADEWDAYAWFGFAIAKAQLLERDLQAIATALAMSQERDASWTSLYDSHGRLTLGSLLRNIRDHKSLPPDLLEDDLLKDLDRVVTARNQLAHKFFWGPQMSAEIPSERDMSPEEAKHRLMAAASLFDYVSCQLLPRVFALLERSQVSVTAAKGRLASILSESP